MFMLKSVKCWLKISSMTGCCPGFFFKEFQYRWMNHKNVLMCDVSDCKTDIPNKAGDTVKAKQRNQSSNYLTSVRHHDSLK